MFTANGFGLHYFDRKNKGEVDFVLQKGQTVIPVEIKSGNSYRFHPALDSLMNVSDWNLKKRMFSARGI